MYLKKYSILCYKLYLENFSSLSSNWNSKSSNHPQSKLIMLWYVELYEIRDPASSKKAR